MLNIWVCGDQAKAFTTSLATSNTPIDTAIAVLAATIGAQFHRNRPKLKSRIATFRPMKAK
jgi:hypothetical protein